jgi:Family of unknown function (DUF6000)
MLISDDNVHARWVAPFYLDLMGAHFVRLPPAKQVAFATSVQSALATVSPAILTAMLQDPNWRTRCVAAWFIGFLRADAFHHMVCAGLHQHPFHAEPYCFALARFGDRHAATCLVRYLSHSLASEQIADESESLSVDWALASLQWLDHQQGTHTADAFLVPHGLWQQFVDDGLYRVAARHRWLSPPSQEACRRWRERWNLGAASATVAAAMAFAERLIDA